MTPHAPAPTPAPSTTRSTSINPRRTSPGRPTLARRWIQAEIYGGTANRFLYIAARRSGLQPDGGNVPDDIVERAGIQLRNHLLAAYKVGTVTRTPAAADLWRRLYERLAADDPDGLVGALIARDRPQVMRLSLVYALADGVSTIDVPHIEAAWALWRYSRATVDYVFGDASGDPVKDTVLAALRTAGPDGLTRTDLSKRLSGHAKAARIDEVLRGLGELIEVSQVATRGRPAGVIRLAKYAEEAKEDG